ncbi:linker for activation of T cells family, member 2, isoform CRA_c [Rattus norvegicus]|uniref:Linker for activation of T cells family, member 2, isoform CRA_c n=1 Tax=Rattus norvegicus TaxID=10116 RepID=A6J0I3_RAT|nr:linker for activation of T cells family, member 2, isoform CRA_c [Rattus norvegicus]
MSAELELLWPLSGLLLLLLLGTTAWLCVQCSRPGVKRNEKIYEQRNQQENEQSVASSQTYSLARPVRTGLQMDAASNKSFERKNKLLFSHLEDNDSNSYENVLICKPSTPESGTEESEDYQNSVSILQWRESKRTMGARTSPSGSPDEEPDYVNGDVATTEKI